MKKGQENKQAEEWVAPSIDVIGINKDTKNGYYLDNPDGSYLS